MVKAYEQLGPYTAKETETIGKGPRANTYISDYTVDDPWHYVQHRVRSGRPDPYGDLTWFVNGREKVTDNRKDRSFEKSPTDKRDNLWGGGNGVYNVVKSFRDGLRSASFVRWMSKRPVAEVKVLGRPGYRINVAPPRPAPYALRNETAVVLDRQNHLLLQVVEGVAGLHFVTTTVYRLRSQPFPPATFTFTPPADTAKEMDRRKTAAQPVLAILRRTLDAFDTLGPVELSGSITARDSRGKTETGSYTVQRNDANHYVLHATGVGDPIVSYQNGPEHTQFEPSRNRYMVDRQIPDTFIVLNVVLDEARAIMSHPDPYLAALADAVITPTTWNDRAADRVTFPLPQGSHMAPFVRSIVIGGEDGLPYEVKVPPPPDSDVSITQSIAYQPKDRPYPPETFVFTPPPKARKW